MWGAYGEIVRQYPRIPVEQERKLIALAKRGSRKSRDEIVLRHVGFVIFRLQRKVFPQHLRRHGPDLLSAAIPVLYQKLKSYTKRFTLMRWCNAWMLYGMAELIAARRRLETPKG